MSTLLLPIIYKAGSCTRQSFVVRTGPSDAIEPPVYVRGVSVNEQKYGIAREHPSHQYLSAMVFSEYRLKDHPVKDVRRRRSDGSGRRSGGKRGG